MGVCDDILKKDISPSCDDPVVQGLEQEGVIMKACHRIIRNIFFYKNTGIAYGDIQPAAVGEAKHDLF